MKNTLNAGIAAAVMLVAASPVAVAAGQPWACKFTAAAGLEKKNGRWGPRTLQTDQPFVLIQESNVLTQKSVATAMFGLEEFHKIVSCEAASSTNKTFLIITCKDSIGGSLVFSPTTGQGGVSSINGATNDWSDGGKISVSHFTCQKY